VNSIPEKKGEIVIYQEDDGRTDIFVTLYQESLWLSLNQIAELFGRDKSVISRHLRKVFHDGELNREATVAFFATIQNEGGRSIEKGISLSHHALGRQEVQNKKNTIVVSKLWVSIPSPVRGEGGERVRIKRQ
jgi:hypothetical protein